MPAEPPGPKEAGGPPKGPPDAPAGAAGGATDPRLEDPDPGWAERFLSTAPLGIVRCDQQARIAWANRRFHEMLGRQDGALHGTLIADVTHPEDLPSSGELLARLERSARGHERLEKRYLRADGTSFRARVTASAVQAPSGSRQYVAVVEDITEEERVEAARESLARSMRLVMDSTGEGIVGVDGAGRLTLANRAAARMLGVDAASLLGRDLHHLVHGDFTVDAHGPAACPLVPAEGGNEPLEGFLDVFAAADGSRREVEVSRQPMVDELGASVGAVITFTDVTERRQLESQLRHAQKMEAIGRLAGGIAHDFNNILAVVTSYTSLMLQDVPAEGPMAQDLEVVKQAADRAARLTRQLLTFSRKHVVEPRVLSLNGVVRDFEKMLTRVIGEDVRLHVRLAGDVGFVCVDPGQMEQVLMNLVVNARDAMPRGGSVTLTTSRAGSPEGTGAAGRWVRLQVADTGHGMDEATAARVFEPFFTTKDVGKGTGLGLSTVYGIVTQAGGTVGVTSRRGEGSTFEIVLPEVPAPEGEVAWTADRQPRADEPRVLLLAEDHPEVREVTQRLLTGLGYTVLVAAGAGEAMQICEAHEGVIDALVTDVVMPMMRGPELASRVRSIRPGIRVLYVSGYTDDALDDLPERGSSEAFLQKPFTRAGLGQALHHLLASAPVGR